MTIAVLAHSGDCSISLIFDVRNFCSSNGSEYAAWPSWASGALRKETAGIRCSASAVSNAVRSYWWFAWSVYPIMLSLVGARWCGFDVEA